MADDSKPTPAELAKMKQVKAEADRDKKEAKAYKDSTVYPETEDVVNKEAPVTGPIGRYATDRLFGRDVPFTERAKGAAVLVPAAAAIKRKRVYVTLGVKYLAIKKKVKNGVAPSKSTPLAAPFAVVVLSNAARPKVGWSDAFHLKEAA